MENCMVEITKLEYWKLEDAIKSNRHLSICGPLDYAGSFQHSVYKTSTEKWLMQRNGIFFARKELKKLLKEGK